MMADCGRCLPIAVPTKVRGNADGGEDPGQSPLHLAGAHFGQRAHRRGDADHDQRDRNGLLEVQSQRIDQRRDGQDRPAAAEQSQQDADDGTEGECECDGHRMVFGSA